VVAKQDRVLEVKAETRTEARTSSQQPPNRIVWFLELDHPDSPAQDERRLHTQDGSSTSLVPSRPHTKPEEEDLADEGTEDEGRSSREGER
jgi:hypothetical protein